MRVNKALIIKYHQQLCSPEERVVIEQWLQEEEEVFLSNKPLENEEILKAEMWSVISERADKKNKVINIQRAVLYIAAACITGLVILVKLQPSLLSRTTVIRNDEVTAKTIVVNQMQLTIPAGSRCWINTPILGSSTATIRFCGAVAVLNKCKTFTLNVVTDDFKCVGKGKDVVKLFHGQTYMAMTDGEYNLIAATEEELKDGIPKLFSSRLTERFKL